MVKKERRIDSNSDSKSDEKQINSNNNPNSAQSPVRSFKLALVITSGILLLLYSYISNIMNISSLLSMNSRWTTTSILHAITNNFLLHTPNNNNNNSNNLEAQSIISTSSQTTPETPSHPQHQQHTQTRRSAKDPPLIKVGKECHEYGCTYYPPDIYNKHVYNDLEKLRQYLSPKKEETFVKRTGGWDEENNIVVDAEDKSNDNNDFIKENVQDSDDDNYDGNKIPIFDSISHLIVTQDGIINGGSSQGSQTFQESGQQQALLTLIGFKGGHINSQINQDRAIIISPFFHRHLPSPLNSRTRNAENNFASGEDHLGPGVNDLLEKNKDDDEGHKTSFQHHQQQKQPQQTSSSFLLGVFDGHGTHGEIVSQYVTQELPRIFNEKLDLAFTPACDCNYNTNSNKEKKETVVQEKIKMALVDTFVHLDSNIFPPHVGEHGGCTASLVFYYSAQDEEEQGEEEEVEDGRGEQKYNASAEHAPLLDQEHERQNRPPKEQQSQEQEGAQQRGCAANARKTNQRTQQLYIANAGDSRTFVATYDLSTKHATIHYISREDKPDLPDERSRIENEPYNGHVYYTSSTSRVLGIDRDTGQQYGLAMSRSIGDWMVGRTGVIPDPVVHVIDIYEDIVKPVYEIRKPSSLIKNNDCHVDAERRGDYQDLSCSVSSTETSTTEGTCSTTSSLTQHLTPTERDCSDAVNINLFVVSATDGMLDYVEPQDIANYVGASLFEISSNNNDKVPERQDRGDDNDNGNRKSDVPIRHPLLALEDLIVKAAKGWSEDYKYQYRDDIAIAVKALNVL